MESTRERQRLDLTTHRAVRTGWKKLEELKFRFECQFGEWSAADRREIELVAESLTQIQLDVDRWPRGESRRHASREIQRVVRISERLLARPPFARALSERLARDLDLPEGTLDDSKGPALPWLETLSREYASPKKLFDDMEADRGAWSSLPWGVRTLVSARVRGPTHNEWWFRSPE